MRKVTWCFEIKNGLKITTSNKQLADTYLAEAEASILRAEKNYAENDLVWTTVVLHYAEYYALYAFLLRIGISSGNHECSIELVEKLIGKENTSTIRRHRTKRIDAQYFLKTGREKEVQAMLSEGKRTITIFYRLIMDLKEKKIREYQEKVERITKYC